MCYKRSIYQKPLWSKQKKNSMKKLLYPVKELNFLTGRVKIMTVLLNRLMRRTCWRPMCQVCEGSMLFVFRGAKTWTQAVSLHCKTAVAPAVIKLPKQWQLTLHKYTFIAFQLHSKQMQCSTDFHNQFFRNESALRMGRSKKKPAKAWILMNCLLFFFKLFLYEVAVNAKLFVFLR